MTPDLHLTTLTPKRLWICKTLIKNNVEFILYSAHCTSAVAAVYKCLHPLNSSCACCTEIFTSIKVQNFATICYNEKNA